MLMPWIRKILKALLVVGSWTALAIIIAIPLARSSGRADEVTIGIAAHALISPFCHQIPERCFHVAGSPMPICTRCFGMLLGLCFGTIFGLRNASKQFNILRPALIGVAGIMLIEWCLGFLLMYNLGWLRWITGCALGAVTGLSLMRAIGMLETPSTRSTSERVCSCTS